MTAMNTKQAGAGSVGVCRKDGTGGGGRAGGREALLTL